MIPITYTDSDRVLGVVGLSSEDISDEFFTARDLPRILSVDLFTWLPNHATLYVEPGTLNPEPQAQFHSDCLTLYCSYFCASKILDAVLGIMARESDGQSEYARLGTLDLRKLSKDMESLAGYYRQTLLKSISAANTSVRVPQSTVVTPTYDPVTG